MSSESTFAADLTDPADIDRELLRLSDEVAARLRGAAVTGRTIGIKVRKADFTTLTRARTLARSTDVAAEIVAVARDLFASLRWRSPRVRLLGVAASGLLEGTAPSQLRFEGPDWRAVEVAQDAVRRRFGSDALVRARLKNG